MTNVPRLAVLTALQDCPESMWILFLWAMLQTSEDARLGGLHTDYSGMQLKGAILAEFTRLDQTPARGTPERP